MNGLSRDDVLRMAREAGFYELRGGKGTIYALNQDHMQRFATLVAAAEREACAKVCDDIVAEHDWDVLVDWFAKNIRARGSVNER